MTPVAAIRVNMFRWFPEYFNVWISKWETKRSLGAPANVVQPRSTARKSTQT